MVTKMASKVETVINNEILMNLIQNYRVIYDKTCREYRDVRKKKSAWKEVADKLGMEVDEAVRRYNSVRTNFSKYLKRQKKGKVSGTGKKDIPKIKEEYEYLRWLTVHIKHRNTTTNYARRRLLTEGVSDPEVDDDLCNADDQANNDEHNSADDETDPVIDDVKSASDEEDGEVLKSETKPKQPWAKVNKPPSSAELDKQFLHTMSNINKAISSEKTEDEDKLFCLSLVSNLKALDSKHKSYAKLQILKVFNDIEWMDSSEAHRGQFSMSYNSWYPYHHNPSLMQHNPGRSEELL